MENNFIHMAASAGHVVAYMIGPRRRRIELSERIVAHDKRCFFISSYNLLYRVRHLTFFLPTSAYFVNGNTRRGL